MPRSFQVGFAAVDVEGLFGASSGTFEEALSESWLGGASVTRYGRTWRISRSRRRDGNIWSGRIGFIKEGEIVTYGWDPKEQDFRTEEAAGGLIVPFVLDIETSAVAFQLRSGVVRPTTFTGAFQALLNKSSVYRWQVRPLVREAPFVEWKETVEVVTEARFRLERPNPDWVDREEVEHIVEALDAEVTRLVARAEEGQGLNVESSLFQQALDHVLREYGRGVIRGLDATNTESEWDSSHGGTMPIRAQIQSETEQDEVPEEDLERTLRQRADELRESKPQLPAEDDGEG